MDPATHDPRLKQTIQDMLYEFLYGPVVTKNQAGIRSLVQRNSQLLHSDSNWFQYRGEIYAGQLGIRITWPVPRLQRHLEPEMQEYLADFKELKEYEQPMVMGFITQVLNSSNSVQDYLRVLPECVHGPLHTFLAMNLSNEPPALTDEQIQDFLSLNQLGIDLLKGRLIRNLIM